MAEKVTTMVLKVDLQCSKCYKKVKKILCQFPQIRDQTFDEKSNTVTITVVCCSPEKIRDKLCRKGGGTIKSIDIKEPKKPEVKKPDPVVVVAPPPVKPKEKPPVVGKPDAVVVVAPPPEKPKEKATVVVVPPPAKPPSPKQAPPPKADPPPPQANPAQPPIGNPLQGCVQYPDCYYLPYYEGPWHQQPQPPPSHSVCGGRSGYDAYGGGYSSSRCSDYFSEENPTSCTVM